jgi:hypothetical protein
MKEVPKKDQPGVAGGVTNDTDLPWTPIKWPPPEDNPIVPDQPIAIDSPNT